MVMGIHNYMHDCDMWISKLGMQEFKYVYCEQGSSTVLWYGYATKPGSGSEIFHKIENQKSSKIDKLMSKFAKEAKKKSHKEL